MGKNILNISRNGLVIKNLPTTRPIIFVVLFLILAVCSLVITLYSCVPLKSGAYCLLIFLVIIIAVCTRKFVIINRNNFDTLKILYKTYRKTYEELNALKTENLTLAHKVSQYVDQIARIDLACKSLLNKDPFREISSIYADYKFLYLGETEEWLKSKPRPAPTAAETVARLKKFLIVAENEKRAAIYKLEYLTYTFPQFKPYLSDFDALMELNKYKNIEEVKQNYDYARDYLTDQEYKSLSTTERNQLALDRYVAKQKTPWQIGRDFELCCAWYYSQKGYQVDLYGIENGKQDLGRDLIVYSWDKMVTYIVQCKCWNKDRPIRENIIAQLYGTTFAYEYENRLKLFKCKIIPVIAIPTFSILSETAKEFCHKLGVLVHIIDYNNFPRIKCNINNGQQIYHLPFDQLYDRTQIKNKGEFYAFTVKEAEGKGFRRAMRHFFS